MIWVVVLSLYNVAFHRQQKWGLNTYLYAPKDDYKHRMFWRELYSVEEAGDYAEQILGSAGGEDNDSLHIPVLNIGEMEKSFQIFQLL